MGSFKLYDCDIGLTIRGVNYDFVHVASVQVEDPESTKLVRGANAGNKLGIVYKEGIKEAKRVTFVLMDLAAALHGLTKDVYAKAERIDAYIVSRTDGSSMMVKNAIISQNPRQVQLDDSAESVNVTLILESFDVEENRKT